MNLSVLPLGDVTRTADGNEVLTAERAAFRRMASCGMLRRVALVKTDAAEELSASFIRLTRIGELGTTLALTSNRRKLRRNT
jgi:hypothetical protein